MTSEVSEFETSFSNLVVPETSPAPNYDTKVQEMKKKVKPLITKRASNKAVITTNLKRLTGALDPEFVKDEIAEISKRRKTIETYDKDILATFENSEYVAKLDDLILD